MKHLVLNAGTLLTLQGPDHARSGPEMRKVGACRNGAVLVDNGVVVAAGLRDVVGRHPDAQKARIIDAGGRLVMPGFVDSHSHPVFAAPRLLDFGLRTEGKTYQQIAEAGGGIVSSVHAVRSATEQDLFNGLSRKAERFIECGTTTLEAKTGYGLDWETELKMLNVIRRAAEVSALELIPTFLGAHAFPPELKDRPDEYVKRLCGDMIPKVAQQKLAKFVDVFCEKGYFSESESDKILTAASSAGLGVKVHAEQLTRSGGCRVASRLKAASADHLDQASEDDLQSLKEGGVVATLLPAANYFLATPYPKARAMIDAGVPVALATDFNPGTAPCWNMQTVLSLACTQLKMTIEEAITAATINGAHALRLAKTHGSLEPGKQADLVIFDAEDPRELGYYFGSNLAVLVMKRGTIVHSVLR